jgi:hypothetical protein
MLSKLLSSLVHAIHIAHQWQACLSKPLMYAPHGCKTARHLVKAFVSSLEATRGTHLLSVYRQAQHIPVCVPASRKFG